MKCNNPQQLLDALFSLQDIPYADFSHRLIPTKEREHFIGVRIPALRRLAKRFLREGGWELFIEDLPHTFYEENILHALLLNELKDYADCVESINAFLPFVDNWAVCDTLSPKVFVGQHSLLREQIPHWIEGKGTYTRRFGLRMLMAHFLDDEVFSPDVLDLAFSVKGEDYYLQMMQAWFFATALAEQWQATVPVLEEQRLSLWVHNKTVQKGKESRRLTHEQKEYLNGLRRKA